MSEIDSVNDELLKTMNHEQLVLMIRELEKKTDELQQEKVQLEEQAKTKKSASLSMRLNSLISNTEKKVSAAVHKEEPSISFEEHVDEQVNAIIETAVREAEKIISGQEEKSAHEIEQVNAKAAEIIAKARRDEFAMKEECSRLRNDTAVYTSRQWNAFLTKAEKRLKENKDIIKYMKFQNARREFHDDSE